MDIILKFYYQAIDGRDWSEVDVTSTQLAGYPGVWHGKANLENLRPGTQYMAQVGNKVMSDILTKNEMIYHF